MLALLGGLAVTLVAAGVADAAIGPEPVGTYAQPVYVTSDPGDPDRLYVVERPGRIKLTEGGSTTTFLDIEPLVLSPPDPGSNDDHGMFSIAFSPDYATDHLFYVAYSSADDPDTEGKDESGEWHIAEFEAEGDTADPTSRREVLTIEYPPAQLHYAGQLQFGPDGYLYASTGDGGPQADPDGNAQDLGSLLGKILRIDPQGSVPGQYSVPADNPFAGATPGADEIWSYGLRNPWRFSFDRDTGGLVIGDVGHEGWEEINYRPPSLGGGRGDNFGWNCREGSGAYPGAPGECDGAGPFTDPVFAYPIAGQPECAIMGGYVVRDPTLDDLYGRYVYGDFCTGDVRSIALDVPLAQDDRSEGLSVPGFSLVSFGEDASGGLYVVSLAGPVCRLVGGGNSECADPPSEDSPTEDAPTEDAPTEDSAPEDLQSSPPPPETEPPPAYVPPNNFRFLRVSRNTRKGTARLVIHAPAAGTLRLLDTKRVYGARPRSVGGPGTLRLLVRPKGKARRRLNRVSRSRDWARVNVRAWVRFAPEGGKPRVKSRQVRLIKRR